MILYAGRVDVAQKGCDVLVDAVSRVQARMGACTLVFSGPDWGSVNYLRELARNMGVSAVFTGNLSPDDLKTALVACDVLVLPSISEAFGMSAIEAMICGAPVVATRVGGIPSIVHHEKTGLLVSPRDPQQLADAICRILTEEQLRSRIIANALKLAEGYRIEKTVALLERFYSDLLDL
jgi:glycosyltransferase involved in cell wall biosynthesis